MLHTESESIYQCGRKISKQELLEIQETVGLFPHIDRTELAATICEHLDWFTASGGYKIDACIKLLEKLEAKGSIRLPEKRRDSRWKQSLTSIVLTSRTESCPDIVGKLNDIGSVKIEVVRSKEETGLWNEYVSRYHYLGYKKPFGCFLRYFVVCGQGLLGCIMFAGAAKAITVRDRWIGWTERQRLRNLSWVINNTRFLIFPWVKVRFLSSHILGRIVRRIRQDFKDRWGYKPILVETFVDPRYYRGSCYKASNWRYLGMTSGEGLVRRGKTYTTTPKKIFVKPLVEDFRTLLCSDDLIRRVER